MTVDKPTQAPPGTGSRECPWRCGQTAEGHRHYAVLCRDLDGRLLGRLTPDGSATTRNVHAAILSKDTATRIARNITAMGAFTARAIPF
ncbi:hypothetical protein IU469_30870 [Nocardia puris]|uniref:hypothetical protein n=1 Tax=Nocardia puris TaxID=208602 RepID=UPI0018957FB9|nr:hypothetical protein [Nocardia puris]MBF6213148.1 hypothetical protein [Nocardia puris]MBF6370077.1 hypothetical protein [Nocardia puris]